MKSDKAEMIARFCTSEEVQRWSSGVGRFSMRLHPLVVAEVQKVCNVCPFRCNISVGGCVADDCPVHQVLHLMQRVGPRTATATKEIYKAKYRHRSA